MDPKSYFLQAGESVAAVHIPRWKELPEFDLYIDQVIALAEKNLGALCVDRKGLLTASMINNYVKIGVLTPPINKKYNRTHLAMLMILCAMKSVMEISAIADVLSESLESDSMEDVLDAFAEMYERELRDSMKKACATIASSEKPSVLSDIAIENAIKASAARTIALHAYDAVTFDRREEMRLREQEKEEEKRQEKEREKQEKEIKKQQEKKEKEERETREKEEKEEREAKASAEKEAKKQQKQTQKATNPA